MATTVAKDKPKTQRVRTPKVHAEPCPKSANHTNTKVYKTTGRTRYCRCDDCGHTWKQTGEFADELREYAATLAESLEKSDSRVESDEEVIVMTRATANEIAKELRRLATT